MSLFKQFRTSEDLERQGVLLEYGTASNGKPITIRIARAGGSNVAYMKRLETAIKPLRRRIQTETIELKEIDRLMRQIYAETVVLGWENVEDEAGKPITFSADACVKLFEALPDLFADVQEQAQRLALFRAELREADAGN